MVLVKDEEMAETEVVPEEPQASLKPCKSFLANPEPNSGTSFGMINRLSVDPPPRILKGARTHRAIKIRGMSQPNGCAGRQFEVYIYTRVCVCVHTNISTVIGPPILALFRVGDVHNPGSRIPGGGAPLALQVHVHVSSRLLPSLSLLGHHWISRDVLKFNVPQRPTVV